MYAAVVDDCQAHGAFDPATMGSVPNVGLMAQKAEEYGSHDKTFEIPADGTVRVVNRAGDAVLQHEVEAGDVWRACQVKDAPVRDWVRLAVDARPALTGAPRRVLARRDPRPRRADHRQGARSTCPSTTRRASPSRSWRPADACAYSLERIRRGEDTISVTGNVLRDYLTDLFPIMELGTSAKMLSIVPLMNGGGLFETGAGGSAPKHVQQFVKENHLRWDSLGEFLALGGVARVPRAEDRQRDRAGARRHARPRHRLGARREPVAVAQGARARQPRQPLLPGALLGRRSWPRQTDDPELAARFAPIADALGADEDAIVDELNEVQGSPVDIGGYYHPDDELVTAAMRPSATFNAVIDAI